MFWHKDFLRMSLSNMGISLVAYLFLCGLPLWLMQHTSLALWQAGALVALFGVGMWLPGCFATYLLDVYRRTRVCVVAMLSLLVSTLAIYGVQDLTVLALLRVVQGASYGMTQIALGSTLLVDLTPSERRLEAGYSYYWFGRLSMAIGPLLGTLLMSYLSLRVGDAIFEGERMVMLFVAVIILLTCLHVARLKVPFRAPLQPSFCSLDRLWMNHSLPAYIGFLPLTTTLGMMVAYSCWLSLTPDTEVVAREVFFGSLAVGFVASLLFQRYEGRFEIKPAEVYGGGAMILFSAICQMIPFPWVVGILSPFVLGLGMGMVASAYMVYFVRTAPHCQRGTAHSMYLFSHETGLYLGFFIACLCVQESMRWLYFTLCITLPVVSLACFALVGSPWVKKNLIR